MDPRKSLVDPSGTVMTVDAAGRVLRPIDKMTAHLSPPLRHLAVSLCLFAEDSGHVLLQQRAESKYHFAGKWSNAVCTHPQAEESNVSCVERRSYEELGLANVKPVWAGEFEYRAFDATSGLHEWELDTVFWANARLDDLEPRPSEVAEVRAVPSEELNMFDLTPWCLTVVSIAERARGLT